MDPDANLTELLRLVDALQKYRERGYHIVGDMRDDVDRVFELVQALHQWLSKGGHLPKPWNEGRSTFIVDDRPDLPDHGELFLHCAACLAEHLANGRRPAMVNYARLSVAFTEAGALQVRCVRHSRNVAAFTVGQPQ